MANYIAGIQQVGIGVTDAGESLLYYRDLFGMAALVFDDEAEASLMTAYTGGNTYRRRAALSLNMQGGGGFEVWQFLDRLPSPSPQITYGDTGIYATKIKTYDVAAAYRFYKSNRNVTVSSCLENAADNSHFYVKDKYQNCFQVACAGDWFCKTASVTGGVSGAVIGVTDMDAAIKFYGRLLNGALPQSDEVLTFDPPFTTVTQPIRRVIFRQPVSNKGAFGKLLGGFELELVQCLNRQPVKIFGNRFWGDCGFIHLCFDVLNMDGLKAHLQAAGYPFTVDSGQSFGMEAAAGRFAYVEDPDGTLIELVETHKVPVFKKLGLYLNLKKRGMEKPLPDWMIKLLALNKVK